MNKDTASFSYKNNKYKEINNVIYASNSIVLTPINWRQTMKCEVCIYYREKVSVNNKLE
jgi:hypothetical protein